MFAKVLRFLYTSVTKVPDDDKDKPKHVAHCCIALKCCV